MTAQPQTGGTIRNTRQRSAISALLGDVDGFHSAQELHAMLRDRGERIGLTTVYRTLQSLADAGEIDVMRPAGGEHLYRRCSDGHHHHLICRRCGRTVEVGGPAVESWTNAVAQRYGYVEIDHSIEIFGTCPACVD
ncbi:Fur family transcriptional regulator [Melissospora conviva]|uniref:Fur family transcriptional regulator n=1 Tax=Melissospora conviva TaxID=3388432 RepID=UPI003B7B786C